MKKIHIIVVVLLGIFLMPSQAVACGTTKTVSSCGMEMTSNTKKKDCCSKESHSKSKKEKGCTGKCGMGICSTNSSVNTAIYTNTTIDIQGTIFNFSTKKATIDHTLSFLSDGYSSIWLIPKIG
ncbi:hypothetical protein [Flavobacterium sp.]|uniref:hypothetical protein n=1 Tax=Flavobacterium sp. TaxID=239 RepID=UPI00261D5D7E|nr:hypothetical protein [Flavobacterium sp.]MDG2431604.1 hypothetical protein [Flavobacterium sp.]